MRHNPRMKPAASPNRAARLCLVSLCAGVAACHGHPAPAPGASPAAAPQARAVWHGVTPCADCDAIDAQLVLERGGGDGYRLIESYQSGDTSTRFVEQGHWRRRDALLRLRGDAGSVRVYALQSDGSLQPRGAHGAALPGGDEAALVPVSAEYSP
jgi:NlpE-like protein